MINNKLLHILDQARYINHLNNAIQQKRRWKCMLMLRHHLLVIPLWEELSTPDMLLLSTRKAKVMTFGKDVLLPYVAAVCWICAFANQAHPRCMPKS
ncbi:Uncharacterized protein TCM_032414 [Theobroma cacao]|uniref:Uncharacterized protein n=1 Tax=Theobroma cacao TaxID=3641 RepID=A0A061FH43_THECC|nr:Uncharacterized protein TCM_032414 [Theobroma cacao]